MLGSVWKTVVKAGELSTSVYLFVGGSSITSWDRHTRYKRFVVLADTFLASEQKSLQEFNPKRVIMTPLATIIELPVLIKTMKRFDIFRLYCVRLSQKSSKFIKWKITRYLNFFYVIQRDLRVM